jgi:hypothetical protein
MATHASVVLKKIGRNRVLGINSKRTLSPFYGQIVIYPHGQLVEKDVAIRAKAKNVLRDVWPIVGTTERLDMTGFSVPAPVLRVVCRRSGR